MYPRQLIRVSKPCTLDFISPIANMFNYLFLSEVEDSIDGVYAHKRDGDQRSYCHLDNPLLILILINSYPTS